MTNAVLKGDGDFPEDLSRSVENKGSSGNVQSHACEEARTPKISMAREELVDLTQDLLLAMVLNQLLYWSKRVKDFDLFLEEEKTFDEKPGVDPQYGWFYKSAIELSEETLLRVTKVTMRKYTQVLIEKGWISERSNPLNKWDKTTQYRINLKQLHRDLQELGWDVPSFPKGIFTSKVQKVYFEGKKITPLKNLQISACLENAPSKETFSTLEGKADDTSKVEKVNFLYLTETTTEITNREHTQRTCAREDCDKNFFEEVLRIWSTCTSQGVHPTEERQQRIYSLLAAYFENDLAQWQSFCERVAHSPFLMGQGPRKWRVSLDWILVEENLLKVLEGNFDDGNLADQKTEKASEDARNEEINAVLSSIEDPVWREWCSQLDFSYSSRDPVSLGELKAVTDARFLEVENDRLVWIGSSNAQVLSCIEDLRFKLLSPIKRTFPKVRNLRTRLDEKASSLQTVMPDTHIISAKLSQPKGDIHYAQ